MAETFMINTLMTPTKKYDEIRKVATGRGDGCITTRCLLDYSHFKDNCQLTDVDLRKQKAIDTDPRAIKQIEFYGKTVEKTVIGINYSQTISRDNFEILLKKSFKSFYN